MLRKVLIANRGEIACRIITTLRRLGVASAVAYSDADASTLGVRQANEAVRIGPAAPSASYLDGAAIIAAALSIGADGIHPGYGFLAERATFAEAVEAAGLAFIGPTPDQLRSFGAKHEARALARQARVPVLAASGLVADLGGALSAADAVGYPLILKATAGGGGIGMKVCADGEQLAAQFDLARRQAEAAFGDGRVYLERYLAECRHVEVQVFGDGHGEVLVLGDRDCSVQRRHQKIVEEAPAPGLPDALRHELAASAQRLCAAVGYRSTGTVEFLVDVATATIAFLEVNARLQVEHTVTETVHGIDLVEWMVRLAGGDRSMFDPTGTPGGVGPPGGAASGHAIEVRVCAENPWRDLQPSSGVVSHVRLPEGVRVDTWVEPGAEVTTHYDSLLAKVIASGPTREAARQALAAALAETEIEGLVTNLDLLRSVVADDRFAAGRVTTSLLDDVRPAGRVVEVMTGGTQSTVQDVPGRLGLWRVGIPPSGAIDDLSFRLGNRALGNPEGSPGLELTASGPTLVFHTPTTVCLTGAPTDAELDGEPMAMWEPVAVGDGSRLTIGAIGPPGIRAYLLFRGGLAVPPTLGSRATFILGLLGGPAGRALRTGDLLHLGDEVAASPPAAGEWRAGDPPPAMGRAWELAVVEGPHATTDLLTEEGIRQFYATEWKVHHNSDRTGIRLIGPPPLWARADGGEAGLHPSNIHDTAYAVGAVDFTGDMPILLGPDGPSLGGFVCPAVVAVGDRWKMGQLRADDSVTFVPVALEQAHLRRRASGAGRPVGRATAQRDAAGGLIGRWEADGDRPAVTWRRSGEDYLMVEYGPMVLDLALRFRVHTLDTLLVDEAMEGIIDLTPGIRSLQIHFDPDRLSEAALLARLQEAEESLPPADQTVVASRVVHLPLSWDDPATREATQRYLSTVRPDAPWGPWNIEFIRRINGLDDVAAVHRIVFDASYLVLGLGDVYLGAPVATPVDPRHRLVTTKYNPARTWTPENAVGIGGAYLCIYGMEGPGGYQFVGRTVPVWNRYHRTAAYTEPWLLRFFDQIRFFEVSAADLLTWRREVLVGRAEIRIEDETLRLSEYRAFCDAHRSEIAAFQAHQQGAFNEERARWAAAPATVVEEPSATELPPGTVPVEAAMPASVWKVLVEEGQTVQSGDPVIVLESMKMEITVRAPAAGRVARVMVRRGQEVLPGQALIALMEDRR